MPRGRSNRQTLGDAAAGVAKIGATVAILSAATVAIRLASRRSRQPTTEGTGMDNVLTDVGPVDLAVIRFTGNRFTGEVTPALLDLVQAGTVRVLDALFVYREPDGTVGAIEIGGLGPDLQPAFVAIDGNAGLGLLDQEDVAEVGGDLDPNTSALLLVFENTWAARFAGACRRAGGELVDIARVPSKAVAETLGPLGLGPIGA
jgi:hypothetical protein